MWNRLRRRGESSADGDGSDAPEEGEPLVSWSVPSIVEVDLDLTEGKVVQQVEEAPVDPDRQAAYADWAERMRKRREQKLRSVRSETDDVRRVNYWSEDALFQESRLLEEEPGRVVQSRRDLLAVLGLSGEASAAEVQRQYRRLAKLHHPDRFHDADDATREEHAEQMQRITSAYRALQRA